MIIAAMDAGLTISPTSHPLTQSRQRKTLTRQGEW